MDKPQTTTSPAENKKLGLTDEIACSIGNRIQEAREKKSKTHKQIAAKIRVKESYLEAIESGNWELLPVGVNGRGFIRLYARELDVSLPEFDEFSQSKSQYQVLAEDYEKVVAIKSKKEAKKNQKKTTSKKIESDTSSEPKLIIDDLNSKVCLVGQNVAERGSIIEELNEELNGSADGKNSENSENSENEKSLNLRKKIQTYSKKIFLLSLSICFLYGIFVFFNEDSIVHDISQSFFEMKTKISSVFEKNDVIVAVPEQPIAATTENLNQDAVAPTQPQPQVQVQEQPQVQAQLPESVPVAIVERIAKIDILSPVEIKITADGKSIFSGIHEAGALELSFTKEAEISVADGSKMKLNYGNWDLGVLGAAGRKRKIILDANSYQE